MLSNFMQTIALHNTQVNVAISIKQFLNIKEAVEVSEAYFTKFLLPLIILKKQFAKIKHFC